MHGRKNPPRRSRRHRACTTRCARSRPAPRNGRRWAVRSRPTPGTLPPQPLPWPVWPRQRPALRRRHRRPHRPCRPCRPGSPPRPTASPRMTPLCRSHTMRRRRTTTTHRSCSTRSCRRRPLFMHRVPMRAPWRSTRPPRTRCRIPAATMPRFRITPTTRSGTPTMRLPRRRRESRPHPHLRSTRLSTSHRGKTSPAGRFPRSTHPRGTRPPSRRRTRRNRNRPMPPPRNPGARRLATSPRATCRRPSITTTGTRCNRLPQSITSHRPACRRASTMRTPT